MSFPDFINNESNSNPTFNQEGYAEFDGNQLNNSQGEDWNNIGGNIEISNRGEQQEIFDEEETERVAKRKQEEIERRIVIEQKIELELKLKEEFRVKAMEYLNDSER